MNKLFTQLLELRAITPDFLNPKYEDLSDPSLLIDMDKAVARIQSALQNQEKILIYGDYDVDGITASAVMEQALTLAGAKPANLTIMLPDRFTDGYGMSPKLVTAAKDQGITLVITVDCGSRNHTIVDELNALKIDTIITDHHECEDTLPAAIAVINPKRHDFTLEHLQNRQSQPAAPASSQPATSTPSQPTASTTDQPAAHPQFQTAPTPKLVQGLQNLAGVGVAFKLAQALVKAGLIPNGQEKWLLDLVLIGTICDRMTLLGENRILCYYGAIVLGKTRRKGLQALMKNAKVMAVTSESIGFQIGPRLNAAGRLENATIALNLLRTRRATDAVALASQLEQLNRTRRAEQQAAVKEIETRYRNKNLAPTPPVIIETGHWHEGIIGIVAGRLVEKYHRPAFVLTETAMKTPDGHPIYKGSGRSFGDFNLAEALAAIKSSIIGGGGHAGAAGVQVAADQLSNFCEQINEYYRSLHLTDQAQYFAAHPDLTIDSLADFTLDLVADLNQLEPFGDGNPEPIFAIQNATIISLQSMGYDHQHLRIDICDHEKHAIKLIAFNPPAAWFKLDEESPHTFIIQPVVNDFNGTRSIEGRLIDVF